MSKMCRKVKSNLLLLQDAFMLEHTEPLFSSSHVSPRKEYVELERQTKTVNVDGVQAKAAVDVPVVRPYEITPEYVASFVDSIDYKRNPDIRAQKGRGQGLGDVTQAQALTEIDSMKVSDFKSAYLRAQKEIADLKAKQASPVEKKDDEVK